ncbi:ABC transporter permease subunit [Gallaecimonas sp. GXIMD4217]|uniref:ABC transporter permease n=1 Tax=Gallaecimonas sp. GXIMD4217 TaxID=3131927 RepID=UPI00311ABEB2
MNGILTVARKEFLDGLRNRWILAIALMLALLAVGLAYFGAAASGQVGFTSLASTLASLSSLAVVIIPLIALLLGYDAIVGEAERGTLLLLLSYPLGRRALLLGKLLGQGAMLALAISLGFGAAAVMMLLFADQAEPAAVLKGFGLLIATASWLGWTFLALAYGFSAGVVEKSRAAGAALLLWFFFVVLFDLLLLGLLVLTQGQVSSELFPYLLLASPTDLFRLVNLLHLSQGELMGGLFSTIGQADFAWPELALALALWLALPAGLALFVFNRRAL